MISHNSELEFINSLASTKRVSGLTHNFYRYPARFSPEFARETILQFSEPGDYILDAFMGSGTTIVEAITNGRKALGFDVNPLACLISKVKTTPLSSQDQDSIIEWVKSIELNIIVDEVPLLEEFKHLPDRIQSILYACALSVNKLRYRRQSDFAKCVLLRLGQWAIDCKKEIPSTAMIQQQLVKYVNYMLRDLNEFVLSAKRMNINKNKITNYRRLLLGSADEILTGSHPIKIPEKIKLVVTSPPYPGVHVLYHRWQVQSRRETAAPFWLAGLQDGQGEAFYSMGGRSKRGVQNYFLQLQSIFSSIKNYLDEDTKIVQLVAFADPTNQLPAFLESMLLAGYREWYPTGRRPFREVPNRKWYTSTYMGGNRSASKEILLIHKISN